MLEMGRWLSEHPLTLIVRSLTGDELAKGHSEGLQAVAQSALASSCCVGQVLRLKDALAGPEATLTLAWSARLRHGAVEVAPMKHPDSSSHTVGSGAQHTPPVAPQPSTGHAPPRPTLQPAPASSHAPPPSRRQGGTAKPVRGMRFDRQGCGMYFPPPLAWSTPCPAQTRQARTPDNQAATPPATAPTLPAAAPAALDGSPQEETKAVTPTASRAHETGTVTRRSDDAAAALLDSLLVSLLGATAAGEVDAAALTKRLPRLAETLAAFHSHTEASPSPSRTSSPTASPDQAPAAPRASIQPVQDPPAGSTREAIAAKVKATVEGKHAKAAGRQGAANRLGALLQSVTIEPDEDSFEAAAAGGEAPRRPLRKVDVTADVLSHAAQDEDVAQTVDGALDHDALAQGVHGEGEGPMAAWGKAGRPTAYVAGHPLLSLPLGPAGQPYMSHKAPLPLDDVPKSGFGFGPTPDGRAWAGTSASWGSGGNYQGAIQAGGQDTDGTFLALERMVGGGALPTGSVLDATQTTAHGATRVPVAHVSGDRVQLAGTVTFKHTDSTALKGVMPPSSPSGSARALQEGVGPSTLDRQRTAAGSREADDSWSNTYVHHPAAHHSRAGQAGLRGSRASVDQGGVQQKAVPLPATAPGALLPNRMGRTTRAQLLKEAATRDKMRQLEERELTPNQRRAQAARRRRAAAAAQAKARARLQAERQQEALSKTAPVAAGTPIPSTSQPPPPAKSVEQLVREAAQAPRKRMLAAQQAAVDRAGLAPSEARRRDADDVSRYGPPPAPPLPLPDAVARAWPGVHALPTRTQAHDPSLAPRVPREASQRLPEDVLHTYLQRRSIPTASEDSALRRSLLLAIWRGEVPPPGGKPSHAAQRARDIAAVNVSQSTGAGSVDTGDQHDVALTQPMSPGDALHSDEGLLSAATPMHSVRSGDRLPPGELGLSDVYASGEASPAGDAGHQWRLAMNGRPVVRPRHWDGPGARVDVSGPRVSFQADERSSFLDSSFPVGGAGFPPSSQPQPDAPKQPAPATGGLSDLYGTVAMPPADASALDMVEGAQPSAAMPPPSPEGAVEAATAEPPVDTTWLDEWVSAHEQSQSDSAVQASANGASDAVRDRTDSDGAGSASGGYESDAFKEEEAGGGYENDSFEGERAGSPVVPAAGLSSIRGSGEPGVGDLSATSIAGALNVTTGTGGAAALPSTLDESLGSSGSLSGAARGGEDDPTTLTGQAQWTTAQGGAEDVEQSTSGGLGLTARDVMEGEESVDSVHSGTRGVSTPPTAGSQSAQAGNVPPSLNVSDVGDEEPKPVAAATPMAARGGPGSGKWLGGASGGSAREPGDPGGVAPATPAIARTHGELRAFHTPGGQPMPAPFAEAREGAPGVFTAIRLHAKPPRRAGTDGSGGDSTGSGSPGRVRGTRRAAAGTRLRARVAERGSVNGDPPRPAHRPQSPASLASSGGSSASQFSTEAGSPQGTPVLGGPTTPLTAASARHSAADSTILQSLSLSPTAGSPRPAVQAPGGADDSIDWSITMSQSTSAATPGHPHLRVSLPGGGNGAPTTHERLSTRAAGALEAAESPRSPGKRRRDSLSSLGGIPAARASSLGTGVPPTYPPSLEGQGLSPRPGAGGEPSVVELVRLRNSSGASFAELQVLEESEGDGLDTPSMASVTGGPDSGRRHRYASVPVVEESGQESPVSTRDQDSPSMSEWRGEGKPQRVDTDLDGTGMRPAAPAGVLDTTPHAVHVTADRPTASPFAGETSELSSPRGSLLTSSKSGASAWRGAAKGPRGGNGNSGTG